MLRELRPWPSCSGRAVARARARRPQPIRCIAWPPPLDPTAAPAKEVAACYHERWELELVYDELQEHQVSSPVLLSKTAMGVMQEAWAMLLGHYALRAWMMRSAQQSPAMDVDRLSFTQAICVLGTALTLS